MESIFRHLTKLEEFWPRKCQWTRQQVDVTLVVSSCVGVVKKPEWLFLPWFCFPSVHAAVIAINEAVDRGQLEITAASLRNPNALLSDLQEAQMGVYQEMLRQAKAKKKQHAAIKVHSEAVTLNTERLIHYIKSESQTTFDSKKVCVVKYKWRRFTFLCILAWSSGGQRYLWRVSDLERNSGHHQPGQQWVAFQKCFVFISIK